jgi:pimeloyl-ACP methyl ester carboxylesterase
LALSSDCDTEVDRIVWMLDALGLDRIELAGHDDGGFLGLGFLQRYPDRVRRLAILNSRADHVFPRGYYQLFSLLS